MSFFEDTFLDYLAHAAPARLIVVAFLVVFLTHTPRQRGLTLAIIGCAVSLFVSLASTLRFWSILQDNFVPQESLLNSPMVILPLQAAGWSTYLLWIISLYLLYRDSVQRSNSIEQAEVES
tara:strand:- start:148 stop:510 length:363 start_codon:yes stop_codon:yes gene_type:complete